jgi:hypothetical protein
MQTLNALDARIENRLNMLYANAIQSEAWTKTFALQDPKEYLANGVCRIFQLIADERRVSFDFQAYITYILKAFSFKLSAP